MGATWNMTTTSAGASRGSGSPIGGDTPVGTPEVHPRVRRAHCRSPLEGRPPFGPSRRLRGSRASARCSDGVGRSIPVSAGLTRSSATTPRTTSVHPRVCGAHPSVATTAIAKTGPSPRLRGSPRRSLSWPESRRSIPASAGLTAARLRRWCPCPVHPRVCGAHRVAGRDLECVGGPSPRLRGSPLRVRGGLVDGRSIPASAGLTQGRWERCTCRPVHPRVCGAHQVVAEAGHGGFGPSPRLRGSRHHHLR